jgi:hypothetical protein
MDDKDSCGNVRLEFTGFVYSNVSDFFTEFCHDVGILSMDSAILVRVAGPRKTNNGRYSMEDRV